MNPRVLIVDDDSTSRNWSAWVLRRSGYEVLTANSAADALDIVAMSGCRLVVSDWRMPGMDGLALCQRLRSGRKRHDVYFILLTSDERPQDTAAGQGSGPDDYLVKPCHAAELLLRVNAGRRVLRPGSEDQRSLLMAAQTATCAPQDTPDQTLVSNKPVARVWSEEKTLEEVAYVI